MTYAIIQGGVVTNIVVGNRRLTSSWIQIPAGMPAALGDLYEGGRFFAPDGSARMTPEQAQADRKIEALEREKALLAAQVQALCERGEFLEDCLAEMAAEVYA